MSERGIEIHNGKVIIPGSQMKELELGTWASPLTQTEAAQVIVSAVVNAIALGGAVHAGYFGVKASVSLTGDLRPLRSRATINDGITLTGTLYGLHIETEVLGAGIITSFFEGIRLEHYVEAGADLTASQVYGIHIANSIGSEPSGYSFIRMSENAASTVNHVFQIVKGAACLDIEYLFDIVGAGSYYNGTATDHTSSSGWIKVRLPGADRYLQLFT